MQPNGPWACWRLHWQPLQRLGQLELMLLMRRAAVQVRWTPDWMRQLQGVATVEPLLGKRKKQPKRQRRQL